MKKMNLKDLHLPAAIFLGLLSSMVLGVSSFTSAKIINDSIAPLEPISMLLENQEKFILKHKLGELSSAQIEEFLQGARGFTETSYSFSKSMVRVDQSLMKAGVILFLGQLVFWGLYVLQRRKA
jgi:hypothetical protein